MNNHIAVRPEKTVDNHRFGWVRADEVRVRDIIEFSPFRGPTEERMITKVELVGDDIILYSWDKELFTTSVGNGVNVVGRAGI